MDVLEPLEADWSSVNTPDASSLLPLHYAAAKGYLEVCQVLVAQEAIVDALDSRKWTALHWAAYKGHVEVCQYLVVEALADVNARSKELMTPLLYAAYQNSISLCEALLDLGAEIDAANNDKETALFIATSMRYFDLALLLVRRGADPALGKANGVRPLHWAVRHGHFPVATALMSMGASVQDRLEEGFSVLQLVPADASTLKKNLVEREANLNALLIDGYTPLHYAVITAKTDARSVEIAEVECEKLVGKAHTSPFYPNPNPNLNLNPTLTLTLTLTLTPTQTKSTTQTPTLTYPNPNTHVSPRMGP